MKLYTNEYFKPQIAFQNIYLLPFKKGLPGWLGATRFCLQCSRCRRCRFDPWVRKSPWRRKWQPTPGFLPRKMPWTGAWQATVRRITKCRTRLSNCVRMPCNKRSSFQKECEGSLKKALTAGHVEGPLLHPKEPCWVPAGVWRQQEGSEGKNHRLAALVPLSAAPRQQERVSWRAHHP